MNNILFIDFDETLFYHHAYLSWVDDFLHKQGHITKPGVYAALIEDFHEDKGELMRLYDHAGHIKTTTGKNWSFISSELEKEIHEKEHDFCYNDAHEFLRNVVASGRDARILTYGDGEYQHYKMRTCNVLRELHIPVHVVHEPKRIFLKREFKDGEGTLIDDKYPLDLPKGWKHIWINRDGKKRNKSNDVQKVKSLEEIKL